MSSLSHTPVTFGFGTRALLAFTLLAGLALPSRAETLVRWSMDYTGINNPAVVDGQLGDAVQNLWSVNSLGNAYVTSGDVPPWYLCSAPQGNAASYNAAALANVDGALLYPQLVYGDRFNLVGGFTVELFFKTVDDKQTNGPMQLLRQGENNLRYGVSVNEPGPGNVRFSIRDSAGNFWQADLAVRNYAEGEWHYLLATYDPAAGAYGTLTLTVVNEDHTSDTATTVLDGQFAGLPVRSDGNLFIGRYTYSRSQARTFLGLIDEVQISSGVVDPRDRAGVLPGPLARWSMFPTGTNWPAVLDSNYLAGAQDLLLFSSAGNQYPSSTDVPPPYLFSNGQNGGTRSFNAGSLTGIDGALFYPENLYGNWFSFGGGFSVELFFKTSGNRSGSGFMELLMQGERNFRYGIIVNEPNPGGVRFAINDDQGQIPVVDLAARNYADGQWHYLLARYVAGALPNGLVSLSIANQDGSVDHAVTQVPPGFKGLPAENDGNLFIGRNTFAQAQAPRTFLGWIDELQVSAGSIPIHHRLGKLPQLGQVSASRQPDAVMLSWTASPGESYAIEYADSFAATAARWTPIGAVVAASTNGTFADIDPNRLARPAGFYRVRLK